MSLYLNNRIAYSPGNANNCAGVSVQQFIVGVSAGMERNVRRTIRVRKEMNHELLWF
jgi:hypothetical protein